MLVRKIRPAAVLLTLHSNLTQISHFYAIFCSITSMELLPFTPEAHKRRATDLTRDDRIRIATLREEGFTYKQISQRIDCTQSQVRYACFHPLTPKKRKGRPLMLTQEQIDEIITWIYYSKANRRAS